MDIVNKRAVKGGNGNASSQISDIVDRAGSWQYGSGTSMEATRAESKEENLAFGTPDGENALRNPADGNPSGMELLKNAHNFSSNPGFMSTDGMLGASTPAGGGVIRSTLARGPLQ